MTRIDIYSGFLGAGKTTLIKKMIKEAYSGEKLVLIENEFGEIGIDGGFLQEAGIAITEMNSGCICCSLVGDFGKALEKVVAEYAPDRILIEPSGVGKLSDVIKAVQRVTNDEVKLGNFVTVADATKCKMYMKNFGEFYNNQIETANTIILSRTDGMPEAKLDACVDLIREKNHDAVIVTTPWPELTGAQIEEAMEKKTSIALELEKMEEEAHHHHHHDDDDDECDDPDCSCHHHHHDDDDDECECGCHDHDHHHHHADEVFTSWGRETIRKFTRENLEKMLEALSASDEYGIILRAKGMLPAEDGTWIYFDMVPEETEIREGAPEYTGRLCVIGSKLKEDKLAELFGL